MTPKQVQLVQTSFILLSPKSKEVAEIFYENVFEIAPSARAMFPGDLTGQRKKLMQMLAVAVSGLSDLPSIVPAVKDLGRRHVGYNVVNEHYDVVGQALLISLATGLGDVFTDDIREAWEECYALLAGVMKEAANELTTAA